uniref:Exocyst complex component Sec10 n=1 Tax=Ditylum brightwellii TaxID=49249 RepID=A0A7S4QI50_9STRA
MSDRGYRHAASSGRGTPTEGTASAAISSMQTQMNQSDREVSGRGGRRSTSQGWEFMEEEKQRYKNSNAEEGEEDNEVMDRSEEREADTNKGKVRKGGGDEGNEIAGEMTTNDMEIPEEYLYDPFAAEPSLDNLRSINPQTGTLKQLLSAADADVLLHSARIRAVLLNDPSLLRTYNPENDETYLNRRNRSITRDVEVRALREEARNIMRDIDLGPTSQHMTAYEISREKLDRWQRALELYVHCPDDSDIDLLGLLEKLCEGCSEEEELSEALSQASQMCTSLVEQTSLAVRDATEDAAEAEDAYHIRLEAHSILTRRVCEQSDAIEEQFRTNGRAALKIGQQLELAEAKRRQCESASFLIKTWWMMENLAEQEELSGEEIQVNEEVRGYTPHSSCKMDPLFTKVEHSLEAARALKALRTVVKSRGNSASGSLLDPGAIRRFEVTSRLIQRTSAALEARLLNSFSEVYSEGGVYDFSSEEAASRKGRLNWVLLRELAEALMCFDSGRSLHKRYVHMVVTSRFPELFNDHTKDGVGMGGDSGENDSNEEGGSDDEDVDAGEFDADETRSKLSSLFHRVTEVCTAEFSLIAHVFGTSSTSSTSGSSGYDSFASSSSGADTIPLQVVRALLQRVISDPRNGLQARINDLLESIDKRGDFLAGAKKLDTFVVIHEKAAGLFILLKESAEQMLIPMAQDNDGDRR